MQIYRKPSPRVYNNIRHEEKLVIFASILKYRDGTLWEGPGGGGGGHRLYPTRNIATFYSVGE